MALKNNIKRLKDKEVDFYRLRVGSYRWIFQKEEKEPIIPVIGIGHREEVYLETWEENKNYLFFL